MEMSRFWEVPPRLYHLPLTSNIFKVAGEDKLFPWRKFASGIIGASGRGEDQ